MQCLGKMACWCNMTTENFKLPITYWRITCYFIIIVQISKTRKIGVQNYCAEKKCIITWLKFNLAFYF